MRRLKIGTRGSELALWQAGYVRDAMRRAHPGLRVALEIIRTRGDDVPDAGPAPTEGKGLFTGEIERALLTGRVDLAVHSLKDLPTEPVGGLALAAFPERADPADALVARDGLTLDSLPHGAELLTGSPRRRAQVLHRRPDLMVSAVRGNVGTRLRKLDESGAYATVLACAGLERLGLADRITERFEPAEFLPACGQGALAVQIRADDAELAELCAALDDLRTRAAVTAERAFLAAMGGGCRAPLGAFARCGGHDGPLIVTGMVAGVDGAELVRCTVEGPASTPQDAEALGRRLARIVLAEGGQEVLNAIAAANPTPGGDVR